MTLISPQTHIEGAEEVEEIQKRRVSKFLFFEIEWWETIKTTHLGNDINIDTLNPIRNVYLNGKLIYKNHAKQNTH
jgi:hypothetical protein